MAMLISNRLVQRLTVFSLKLFELIQSSEAKVFFFLILTQDKKIPVFEINSHVVFHRA